MRRLFHAKVPASLPPMESGQASAGPAQAVAPASQRSRRGMFGWLRSAGLGLAAAGGAGLLWKQTSQTAYADNVGNFSSSTNGVAAVYATGSNGGGGVVGSNDSFSALSGTSVSGSGVDAESYSSYGVHAKSTTSIGVYSTSDHTIAVYGAGRSGRLRDLWYEHWHQ